MNNDNHSQVESDNGNGLLTGRINQRSEIALEIINLKPNFFEKWGLQLFASIFLILLALSYFFKYPDTIEGVAYLSSQNAPKSLIVGQSGRLVSMLGVENQEMKKGDPVGFIESPKKGDHREILRLDAEITKAIDRVSQDSGLAYLQLLSKPFMRLGEVEDSYQKLLTNIALFREYKGGGYFSQKKLKLLHDIHSLEKIDSNTMVERDILLENAALAQESFEMNEKLYRDKVISPEEYRQQKSKLLNNRMNIPYINSSLINTRTQKADKFEELRSIDFSNKQQKDVILQSLFILKTEVEQWLNAYCISAPIDGFLNLESRSQKDEFLKAGESIGFLIPKNGTLYSEITLNQLNFGKIDTSMEVQLRFDAYPYQEYGSVIGRLVRISKIANQNGFVGSVELKNGLRTNQHITLNYREGLQARAIVITKKMNLMKRFWYSVVKRFDKK